ncbi:hypothetical protein L2D08_15020 [Domibacillus sp. PGB-M46]|nr:hypothetical protein [Domibacillus sp. PGB-M46]MCI2255682.1 hypothetical protein [Domibacillus sp. PGB-M46]
MAYIAAKESSLIKKAGLFIMPIFKKQLGRQNAKRAELLAGRYVDQ